MKATASGFVHAIEAEQLGIAAMLLGAGRATKEAEIDYSVGVMLSRKAGEHVEAGDVLAVLHVREEDQTTAEVAARVRDAYAIDSERPAARPLLLSVVTADGITRYDN
ncbi:Pyrimidine-nucleoside phosphorylase [compost metagenome]